jgi:hypothetical protein
MSEAQTDTFASFHNVRIYGITIHTLCQFHWLNSPSTTDLKRIFFTSKSFMKLTELQ